MKKYEVSYICQEFQIGEDELLDLVATRLIEPLDSEDLFFDEEDVGRIRFILEMKNTYQTNDESIEVMLHLLDQIHALSSEIKKIKKS